MVANCGVIGHAGHQRLVSAIHRRQVDVDIDDQVAFGNPSVEPNFFAHLGLTDENDTVWVFGVVVVKSERVEGFENSVANLVAQFVRSHFSVQARRCNQMYVVNALVSTLLQDAFNDELADVRLLHWRQRERKVVKNDRDLHPPLKLCRKRVCVYGFFNGVFNGRVKVCNWLN